jgi:hypothetical protein
VPGEVEDVPLDERGIDFDRHGVILPASAVPAGDAPVMHEAHLAE